jgi:hypothetical protein
MTEQLSEKFTADECDVYDASGRLMKKSKNEMQDAATDNAEDNADNN